MLAKNHPRRFASIARARRPPRFTNWRPCWRRPWGGREGAAASPTSTSPTYQRSPAYPPACEGALSTTMRRTAEDEAAAAILLAVPIQPRPAAPAAPREAPSLGARAELPRERPSVESAARRMDVGSLLADPAEAIRTDSLQLQPQPLPRGSAPQAGVAAPAAPAAAPAVPVAAAACPFCCCGSPQAPGIAPPIARTRTRRVRVRPRLKMRIGRWWRSLGYAGCVQFAVC